MGNALQYSAMLPLVLSVVHARTDLVHMCVDMDGWIKCTPIILILPHTLKQPQWYLKLEIIKHSLLMLTKTDVTY